MAAGSYNFFIKVSVTTTTFPTNAQIYPTTLYQKGFSIANEGSSVIQYSFDGITIHGDLTPNLASVSLTFAIRPCSALWLCVPSGVSSTCRFESWGY